MNKKPLIEIEGLSKAYRLGEVETGPDTLIGAIKHIASSPFRNLKRLNSLDTSNTKEREHSDEILWALKDINLSIDHGDVLGVIGHNGAGKSTLLKIISRITDPTHGKVTLRGRVSSLLEVGTGFHPELSGRDNVYMNGSILGMTKREIDRKFDEIVDFAGIEKFLDTPTKRYSSGMQTRLAFAVAAHLEPEILIVDEVLAVGDAAFQKKCMGKMRDVSSSGRTVVFVSHNLGAIESICNRGVVIQHGVQTFTGNIKEATTFYRSEIYKKASSTTSEEIQTRSKFIKSVDYLDEGGNKIKFGQVTKHLTIETKIDFGSLQLNDFRMRIGFDDLAGNRVLTCEPSIASAVNGRVTGKVSVRCFLPEIPLAPGTYSLWFSLADSRQPIEEKSGMINLNIEDGEMYNEGRSFFKGAFTARSNWEMQRWENAICTNGSCSASLSSVVQQ
ncbi:ABC transporter ATP-binding protein [Rhodopirellula sp.]|nr:ABC transporter ATP-binding protein [Rhodopirellula sp.]